MSEQNASVAQAYAIVEHFSERARREAAAQHYFPTYLGNYLGAPYTMPRCDYKGRKCCPMGVMRLVDGHEPEYTDPTPIPTQIALGIVRHTQVTGEARLALASTLTEMARRFTNHWDRGVLTPDRLAAALGLVPPSADEQTHGD